MTISIHIHHPKKTELPRPFARAVDEDEMKEMLRHYRDSHPELGAGDFYGENFNTDTPIMYMQGVRFYAFLED